MQVIVSDSSLRSSQEFGHAFVFLNVSWQIQIIWKNEETLPFSRSSRTTAH